MWALRGAIVILSEAPVRVLSLTGVAMGPHRRWCGAVTDGSGAFRAADANPLQAGRGFSVTGKGPLGRQKKFCKVLT